LQASRPYIFDWFALGVFNSCGASKPSTPRVDKNYLLASAGRAAGRAAELAAELADQYLLMARGEIIARGLGRDMQTDGMRERVATCST